MQDKIKNQEHRVVMENRQQLSLTGIQKVQSFAPKEIVLETIQGLLSIKGGGLGIKHLDLQGGVVEIEGTVDNLSYSRHSGSESRQNLLGRIFR